MFNVGISELFVFGIIALLVLGPEKLPEAARFAGKWYAKLMHFVNNAQKDIDRELRLSELREQIQKEMQHMAELEQKMQVQLSELQQQTMVSKGSIDTSITKQESKQKVFIYNYFFQNKAYYSVFTPSYFQINLQIKEKQSDYRELELKSSFPAQLKVIV